MDGKRTRRGRKPSNVGAASVGEQKYIRVCCTGGKETTGCNNDRCPGIQYVKVEDYNDRQET